MASFPFGDASPGHHQDVEALRRESLSKFLHGAPRPDRPARTLVSQRSALEGAGRDREARALGAPLVLGLAVRQRTRGGSQARPRVLIGAGGHPGPAEGREGKGVREAAAVESLRGQPGRGAGDHRRAARVEREQEGGALPGVGSVRGGLRDQSAPLDAGQAERARALRTGADRDSDRSVHRQEPVRSGVPLTAAARAALDSVCPKEGLIFGRHDYRNQLRKAVKDALPAHRAALFIGAHFRSARITHWLENTGNLPGTQHMAGHLLVTTTARYSKSSKRAAESMLEDDRKALLPAPKEPKQLPAKPEAAE